MAKIIASIVWCIIYAASLLPLKLHYLFSDLLAWLLRDIFAYRKSTIYINLSRSFPQLGYREIKELSKRYYKYMCDIMVESIWQISASDRRLCKMVDMEGGEIVDDLMERYGKVIALLGHRGNWEMLGTLCRENATRTPHSFSNNEIIITYKVARSKVANLLFEKIRMHEYRKFRNPGRIVSSKQILHHAATAPEKGLYIFIADQYFNVLDTERFIAKKIENTEGGVSLVCRRTGSSHIQEFVREAAAYWHKSYDDLE